MLVMLRNSFFCSVLVIDLMNLFLEKSIHDNTFSVRHSMCVDEVCRELPSQGEITSSSVLDYVWDVFIPISTAKTKHKTKHQPSAPL